MTTDYAKVIIFRKFSIFANATIIDKYINIMLNCLRYVLLSVSLFILTPSISAGNGEIERFAEVVDSLHKGIVFPYTIAPGIVLTNIGVDKDEKMLVINYMLNPEMVETVAKNVASENGIAQLLTGYDEIFSISMINAEAGYKFIITSPSADGLNSSRVITVPASAIPPVYAKFKNGDYSSLKPYLEMLQSSFSNMQFPIKIVNGVWVTDAYIKDKEANWVYKIEGDVDASSFSDETIMHNRINLLNNLRANMSHDYVTEIEQEGITLHYTYRNEQGEKLFEFIFTAQDLK